MEIQSYHQILLESLQGYARTSRGYLNYLEHLPGISKSQKPIRLNTRKLRKHKAIVDSVAHNVQHDIPHNIHNIHMQQNIQVINKLQGQETPTTSPNTSRESTPLTADELEKRKLDKKRRRAGLTIDQDLAQLLAKKKAERSVKSLV